MIRANHPSTVLLELLQHQKNKHSSSLPRCKTKFVPKDVSYDAEMMENRMVFNPYTNTANVDQYHLVDNNGMKTIRENHRVTPFVSRATPLASRATPLAKRVSFVSPLTTIVRMPTPYNKTEKRIRKTPKAIYRRTTHKRRRNNSREKKEKRSKSG
jgi:hypothetical protein